MEEIKLRLVNIEIENYESKYYIPFAELECNLNEENVTQAVLEASLEPYERDEVVKTVLGGGKRIFAILLRIGRLSAITSFIEHDHLQTQPIDSRLPLSESALTTIIGSSYAASFYREQWRFIAPLFRDDLSHRILDKATILPFSTNIKLGGGAFGAVYEVTLDARHQASTISPISSLSDLVLVRKEVSLEPPFGHLDRPQKTVRLDSQEGRVLSFLRLIQHRSIVRFIGSYSYRNTYNLLFERADCDLASLLDQPQRMPAFKSNSTFIQAIQGLCAALASFHRFTDPKHGLKMKGYHHDLKPANVLVKGSRFLLSDFGLSNLKDLEANSKTISKGVAGYYIAPECENAATGFERQMVGQPGDIWALGCILAVILTYMQRGSTGVTEFEQRRKYTFGNWTTYTFHCASSASPEVEAWLNELESTTASEVAEIVNLIRDMLKINPSERPNADEVCSRMNFVAVRSMYLLTRDGFNRLEAQLYSKLFSVERDRFVLVGQSLGLEPKRGKASKLPDFIDDGVGFDTLVAILQDLHRTIDTEHMDSMLSVTSKSVREKVGRMWHLLPTSTRSELQNSLEARIVNTVDLIALDTIQRCFRDQSAYRNIGLLAAIKSMVILAAQGRLQNPRLKLDPSLFDVVEPEVGPFSNIAWVQDQQTGRRKMVLVQWLEYDDQWQGKTGEELFQRTQAVSTILADDEKARKLRSLPCRGVSHFESRHSFGLIFDLPSFDFTVDIEIQRIKPITLTNLIRDTRQKRQRPDIGQVFKLAKKLAATVLEWHKIGWVHRRICSSNIIYFPGHISHIDADFAFLGFQLGRPNTSDIITTGPPEHEDVREHCHPAYLKGDVRHLPEFDYYSLGLVLLELGYWKPLKNLVEKFDNEDQSPDNLRVWILENPVRELHMTMGGVYQKAVSTCLTFESDTNAVQDHSVTLSALEAFEAKVLSRLGMCFA